MKLKDLQNYQSIGEQLEKGDLTQREKFEKIELNQNSNYNNLVNSKLFKEAAEKKET